ncbi:hypothetical protein [Paenibacillus caui]|uniref:hypothetical protein n=1 Tax=Paenibacillus caui TaxID=2873927 RepID=UPI001CA8224D|nr:hypothetical protein [Paenibacillus caui]
MNNSLKKKKTKRISIISVSVRAVLGAALCGLILSVLTGCGAMKPSEQTLQMQMPESSTDLPMIDDVYGSSVESDVYNPDRLRLP